MLNIRHFKRIYLFTVAFIPRIWRNHVQFAPFRDKKLPYVIRKAGKCSKPPKESETERKLKERAKAQRIIDYIFGKGEFPYKDVSDFKDFFGVHKDQLAQIFAPQVHLKNEAKAQKIESTIGQAFKSNTNKDKDLIEPARNFNKQSNAQALKDGDYTFIKKVEKFYESPNFEESMPRVSGSQPVEKSDIEKSNKSIGANNYNVQSSREARAPTEAETLYKDKLKSIYEVPESINGADLAEAARLLSQKIKEVEKDEETRVIPIYPGKIKRLYYDPFQNSLSEHTFNSSTEMSSILEKHEKCRDKPKIHDKETCKTTSELESIRKRIFKNRWKAESQSRKIRNLTRLQPHEGPFSLHKKLQENLRKHMASLNNELTTDNKTSAVSNNISKNSKSISAESKIDHEAINKDLVEKQLPNVETKQNPNSNDNWTQQQLNSMKESDALLSKINSKGVALLDEDVIKKLNDSIQKGGQVHTGSNSQSLHSSKAGTMMYSETCSSSASVEPSLPVTKNETSRFENPRDLDVDIEPVFTMPRPPKSPKQQIIHVVKPEEPRPVNAVREILDIAKIVAKESTNNNIRKKDIYVDLCIKKNLMIESPLNNIKPNADAKLTANKIKSETKCVTMDKHDDVTADKPDLDIEIIRQSETVKQKTEINWKNVTKSEIHSLSGRKEDNLATNNTLEPVIEYEAEMLKENDTLEREQPERELIRELVTEQMKTPEIKASIVPAPLKTEPNEPEATPDRNNQPTPDIDRAPTEIESVAPLCPEKFDPGVTTRVGSLPVPVEINEESLTEKLKQIRNRNRMQNIKALTEKVVTEPEGFFFKKRNESACPTPQKNPKDMPKVPKCPPRPPKCPPPPKRSLPPKHPPTPKRSQPSKCPPSPEPTKCPTPPTRSPLPKSPPSVGPPVRKCPTRPRLSSPPEFPLPPKCTPVPNVPPPCDPSPNKCSPKKESCKKQSKCQELINKSMPKDTPKKK